MMYLTDGNDFLMCPNLKHIWHFCLGFIDLFCHFELLKDDTGRPRMLGYWVWLRFQGLGVFLE